MVKYKLKWVKKNVAYTWQPNLVTWTALISALSQLDHKCYFLKAKCRYTQIFNHVCLVTRSKAYASFW